MNCLPDIAGWLWAWIDLDKKNGVPALDVPAFFTCGCENGVCIVEKLALKSSL